MRLIRAKITNFKCIDDSDWVNFEDVTCLVGKNESGKTAFLQALYKLSPAEPGNGNFDHIIDYPRKKYAIYKSKHESKPDIVVSAEYELTEEEIKQIEFEFGKGILSSPVVRVHKNYQNKRTWDVDVNESAFVRHLINKHALALNIDKQFTRTVDDFISYLNDLNEKPTAVQQLLNELEDILNDNSVSNKIINKYLVKFIPRFVYFDDYSIMNGSISIQELIQRKNTNQLSEADYTFLSLLKLANLDLEDLLNESNYESLKSSLEAASNFITDEVFKYWSQNKQLEVQFDFDTGKKILHIRIRNNRHRVTVPFDQRSKGFVWFFSFLAYFSQLENQNYDLILLLDEPGLSLHATAQNDFLRFIDERLAPNYQVVYTTHSPFMIVPSKIDRVRMVQDKDDKGTIVSSDVLKIDNDTIFPLQAALGYELTQTLFIGPNCLLVEGPSDLLYIDIMSNYLFGRGKTGLDPRWVITPVGGADKISTFVTLLGANKLNVAVLVDVSNKELQRIRTLQENALLKQSSLIQASEFTESRDADIEDLFNPNFYLKLVSIAYELPDTLKLIDLNSQNPRITKKVADYFSENDIAGGRFNHYKPAVTLLRNQTTLLEEIDEETERRWEALFVRVNNLLK